MRKVKLIVAIVLVGTLAACHVDPAKKAAFLDEIATLTSLALANKALTPEQRQRIADDGAKTKAHGEELVR